MKVYLKPRVVKHLAKIPFSVRRLINSKLEFLENNPFPLGFKKLSAREGYRIRIGDYRIVYSFDSKKSTVIVVKVEHRQGVYK